MKWPIFHYFHYGRKGTRCIPDKPKPHHLRHRGTHLSRSGASCVGHVLHTQDLQIGSCLTKLNRQEEAGLWYKHHLKTGGGIKPSLKPSLYIRWSYKSIIVPVKIHATLVLQHHFKKKSGGLSIIVKPPNRYSKKLPKRVATNIAKPEKIQAKQESSGLFSLAPKHWKDSISLPKNREMACYSSQTL